MIAQFQQKVNCPGLDNPLYRDRRLSPCSEVQRHDSYLSGFRLEKNEEGRIKRSSRDFAVKVPSDRGNNMKRSTDSIFAPRSPHRIAWLKEKHQGHRHPAFTRVRNTNPAATPNERSLPKMITLSRQQKINRTGARSRSPESSRLSKLYLCYFHTTTSEYLASFAFR